MQLAHIEIAEFAVAAQHYRELLFHRRSLPREQHPQILQRRTIARVIEIDEVRALRVPKHIAGVAVSVQPDMAYVSCALDACMQLHDELTGERLVCRTQIFRDEARQ